MQPLESSTSFSSVRLRAAWPEETREASILTSLMSLTMTATLRFWRLARMGLRRVALPAPTKRERTVTGMRGSVVEGVAAGCIAKKLQ